jgi:hypothetical protein
MAEQCRRSAITQWSSSVIAKAHKAIYQKLLAEK